MDVDAAFDMSVSATSDPAPARGSQRKRARKSGRDQQTLCRGAPGLPCCYAADGSAEPGQGKHDGRCIFCNPTAMAQTLETERGRGSVVRLLKRWRLGTPAVFEAAFSSSTLTSASEEMRLQLRSSAERPVRGPGRAFLASQEEALSWRQSVAAELDAAQSQQYRAKVEEDRAYVQRKFFPQRDRLIRHANYRWRNPMSPDLQGQIHDLAFNDTGLPRASVAPTAERLETWCKQHSWKVCALCGSV